MKVKFRFQKRSSVVITTLACASSILMLVKRFGYPEEELVKTIWISAGFLLLIILLAGVVALGIRYLHRRQVEDFDAEFEARERSAAVSSANDEQEKSKLSEI